jgi:hypothetical protein
MPAVLTKALPRRGRKAHVVHELHDTAMSQWTCFQAANGARKSSNDVLLPRLELKTARRDQVVTGCFSFDINGLRSVGCKPISVQTSVPYRASNAAILFKDIIGKCLRSSNPVASLGESRGSSDPTDGRNCAVSGRGSAWQEGAFLPNLLQKAAMRWMTQNIATLPMA